MYYGNIKYNAIEDGVGCRTVLFVSGCRNHCKNCFQQETWNFSYGKPFTDATVQEILDSLNSPYVDGITLLGGEPFEPENQGELVRLTLTVKNQFPQKTIWAYTGFILEQMVTDPKCRAHTENLLPLLHNLDILVDGPFVEEKKNITLPYRGSENQRVIDMPETFRRREIVLSPYGEKHRI